METRFWPKTGAMFECNEVPHVALVGFCVYVGLDPSDWVQRRDFSLKKTNVDVTLT